MADQLISLYEVELGRIKSFIKEVNAKKILLQAPNGLKPLLKYIINCLQKDLKTIDLYVSGSPSYGSCDLAVDEAKVIGADAIIHLGHTMYPYMGYDIDIPVLYVPVYYKGTISDEIIKRLLSYVTREGIESVIIIASIQYVKIAKMIYEKLGNYGVRVVKAKREKEFMEDFQILGCYYSVLDEEDYDAIIVVSSGLFHGIGACLYKPFAKTLLVDPVREEIMDLSNECKRILAKRFYLISSLVNKGYKSVVITTGTRPGQYRYSLVKTLEETFTKDDCSVYKVVVNYIDKNVLISLDNAFKPDFFIITNCPRLPIDDLGDFYKPVLTPGEALMVANKSMKYRFPW